jgi:hypothetical protein
MNNEHLIENDVQKGGLRWLFALLALIVAPLMIGFGLVGVGGFLATGKHYHGLTAPICFTLISIVLARVLVGLVAAVFGRKVKHLLPWPF